MIQDQTGADEYRETRAGSPHPSWRCPTTPPGTGSPVAEWTARDVVRHLVEWFPGFLAAAPASHCRRGPASTTTRRPPGAP